MSEIQAINIIEDAEGELRVSSLVIADQTENQHKNVLQLIRSYRDDLAEFGTLESETRPFFGADGRTQHMEIFHLNEHQATLLLTYMRNMERIRKFKKALVHEFYRMRQSLMAPVFQIPQTYAAALELAASQARALEVAKPKADAWDELASAEGDYAVSDAAKMLARAGVETGAQRLFNQLSDMRWIFRRGGKWAAYQDAVDSGYLAERPQSHYHPRTGEMVLDAPQIRVTLRGLERLRVRLGSVAVVPSG